MSLTLANDGRPTADTTLRILIVEDNVAMARSLAGIAKNFGNVTVEATVSGALEQLASHAIWIAFIVDLGLPDGSGFTVVSNIRARDRSVPALVLTGNREHDAINAAFDLRAHYLNKPVTRAQITQFLAWSTGRPLRRECSPTGALGPLREVVDTPALKVRSGENALPARCDRACRFVLSPAEEKVYAILVQGASNRQIAQYLHLSVETIRTHVQHILSKLAVDSRARAIAAAHPRNGGGK
jgi:DNA-binding NarL/FixJ family response regulator